MRGLLIIPAYNEEPNLPTVLTRVRQARLVEDVLVVNDGSKDGTEQVLRRLGQNHLRHPINLGYARAIQTGLRFASDHGYDYVVMLDADGQHDPTAVPRLTEAVKGGQADVVVGSRFVEDTGYRAPLGRRLGMLVFSWVTALLGKTRVHDTTSGFKALSRRAFPALIDQPFGDFHAETLLLCMLVGLRVREVPVKVAERKHGVSMYGAIDAVIYPLKTLLAIGLCFSQRQAVARRLKALSPTPTTSSAAPPPSSGGTS